MSSGTDDDNLRFPVTRYPGNLGMEKESIVADNHCFRNIGFKGQEALFRYSPAGGVKVPIGKDLVISGKSVGNSNATYINCHVSIMVNGIKPYQAASASGPSVSGDYSKWTFTLTQNLEHSVIKAGQNKITAMYSCANSPTSLSHYSINVTGININIGNITRLI